MQFTTPNTGSYGNFLDGIQLTLRPFIQLSLASGSGLESIPSANIPTLRVSGTLTSAITVTITITGGTATRGTDYTTPGGGATFTVSVPAGTYYDTPIALGINVTSDSAVEASETITLSLPAGVGYTIGHSTTCGAAAQTTSTYTILNDDSRVTLRKQWSGAVVGDDATVTISRAGSVVDSLASDAGTANELDTDATPTVAVIGETLTLTETLGPSNAGAYSPALACTGAADTNLADGLTIGAGETAILCTYTNSYTTPLAVTKTSSTIADGISTINFRRKPPLRHQLRQRDHGGGRRRQRRRRERPLRRLGRGDHPHRRRRHADGGKQFRHLLQHARELSGSGGAGALPPAGLIARACPPSPPGRRNPPRASSWRRRSHPTIWLSSKATRRTTSPR